MTSRPPWEARRLRTAGQAREPIVIDIIGALFLGVRPLTPLPPWLGGAEGGSRQDCSRTPSSADGLASDLTGQPPPCDRGGT